MSVSSPDVSPPPVSRTPTPEAWLEDEATLHTLFSETVQAVEQAQQEWLKTVQDEIFATFQQVVHQAAVQHQLLLEAAHLDDEHADRLDPAVWWHRLTTYRAGVGHAVIQPLQQFLQNQPPGEAITRILLDRLQLLAEEAEQAPAVLRCPEPDGLFAPSTDDGGWRGVRKSAIQFRRSAQTRRRRWANRFRTLFRREPVLLDAPVHRVPVKGLLRYHVQVRAPEHWLPLHSRMQQATAHQMVQLEHTLTAWMHQFLDAEKALDHPRFHQPSGIPDVFPPSETPAPEVPAPAVLAGLQEQAQLLATTLATLANTSVLEGEEPPSLQPLHEALATDFQHGDTFLLDRSHLLIPAPDQLPASRIKKTGGLWHAWHQQATGRLLFQHHLLSLRNDLLALEDALVKRIASVTLTPILATFDTYKTAFEEAHTQISDACEQAKATGNIEELNKTLRTLRAQFKMRFQRTFRDLPGLVGAEQALSDPGKPEEDQKQYLLTQLPEALYVHLLAPRHIQIIHPEEQSFRINLRTIAQETLAPPFPDQLRRDATPLRERILRIWDEAEHVQEVVVFNLNAAIEDLDQATQATTSDSPPPASAIDTAQQLALDGLARAALALKDLAITLHTPWHTFSVTVFRAVQDDWQDLHQRARSEAAREEQWAGFRIRLARRTLQVQQGARKTWQQFVTQSGRLLRFGRSQAREFIQKGRSAIGVLDGDENAHQVMLDVLAQAGTVQEELPLVYRKLFSFDPVSEVSLLEGRTQDLVRMRQHFERWRLGKKASAVVLVLPLGSGQTSMLQILQNTEFKHANTLRITFPERILDEAELATLLAKTLGVPLEAPTLVALESQLMNMPRPKPPAVGLLDNLEHLVLRAPGGQALMARTLVFFSRTSTRVFWVAVVGTHTWGLIEKTCGVATGLVTSYRLAPLDRPALEALIMNRHRRSGLPPHFVEPPDISPLLRQRLRRARTNDAYQAILREDFFDRLFKQSGQNIMLALYYWLLSTDFDAQEGMVQVNPLDPMDLRFFSRLDAERAFSLKAFLLHHTLTVAEHSRIFRTDDAKSIFLMESLMNLGLIEAVRPELRHGTAEAAGRILPGERYRLHPMLLHPVSEYLRGRHIVY